MDLNNHKSCVTILATHDIGLYNMEQRGLGKHPVPLAIIFSPENKALNRDLNIHGINKLKNINSTLK